VPLDTRWLQQVPVLHTSLTVYYRTVYIPGPGGVIDSLRTRPNEGRWPTESTLYTASGPHMAWAEYCRNNPTDVEAADVTGGVGIDAASLPSLRAVGGRIPLPLRSMFELSFEFQRLGDLLSPWGVECLREAGFPLDDFYADPPVYGTCPELATAANGLGWDAMRVPSAALRDASAFCVPVFRAGRPRLRNVTEAVSAASPTVAVAYATTYADDLRPRWLRLPGS
jgi:hypothetical protein